MKKYFLIFFVLFATLQLSSQIIFAGFDQPICGSPLSITYTYSNYSTGGGSSTIYGFKVYRNGTQVYDNSGSMGTGKTCKHLVFINDSTGFVEYEGGFGAVVIKTADYGNTWVDFGFSAPGFLGFYPVNANFGYLITAPNTWQLFITKCRDLYPPTTWSPLIYDDSINADIYKTDTILGSSLCNIDSLNIFVQNLSGDTIDYHINLFSIPLVIKEQPVVKPIYTIYPNPAKNKINLSGPDFSSFEISSLQGLKIYSGNSKSIDINAFSVGIYFIRVTTLDGFVFNSKFIKE